MSPFGLEGFEDAIIYMKKGEPGCGGGGGVAGGAGPLPTRSCGGALAWDADATMGGWMSALRGDEGRANWGEEMVKKRGAVMQRDGVGNEGGRRLPHDFCCLLMRPCLVVEKRGEKGRGEGGGYAL